MIASPARVAMRLTTLHDASPPSLALNTSWSSQRARSTACIAPNTPRKTAWPLPRASPRSRSALTVPETNSVVAADTSSDQHASARVNRRRRRRACCFAAVAGLGRAGAAATRSIVPELTQCRVRHAHARGARHVSPGGGGPGTRRPPCPPPDSDPGGEASRGSWGRARPRCRPRAPRRSARRTPGDPTTRKERETGAATHADAAGVRGPPRTEAHATAPSRGAPTTARRADVSAPSCGGPLTAVDVRGGACQRRRSRARSSTPCRSSRRTPGPS